MYNTRPFSRKLIPIALAIVLLVACAPTVGQTPVFEGTGSLPNVGATRQGMLTPHLLAEWKMGEINDMAWSPDSKVFAVNYRFEYEWKQIVQAFSVESLKSMWVAENSLAEDLVFTADGQFIVESNIFAPFFYWRSIENGKVVRRGEFTDIHQIKRGDCNGGGQIIIANAHKNIALIVDYNNLLGLSWRTNHIVSIRQLDFETGKCKPLFDYQGFFDLFDLNSSGNLLAFGGEGKDHSAIIWDMERQVEICRTPKAEFGRFVPGEDTLAVVREQKIVLIDAITCQEMRELNASPSPKYTNYLAFSPDGELFAVATDSIEIRSTSTEEILAQLSFPEKAVPISIHFFLSGIKFSPDGRYLLIAYYLLDSADHGDVQLWQLKP